MICTIRSKNETELYRKHMEVISEPFSTNNAEHRSGKIHFYLNLLQWMKQ